jgi:hypothetical protein
VAGSAAIPARSAATEAANRGLTVNPSRARVAAGVNRSRHGVRPCSRCASSSIRMTPGTPIDRPLARALGFGGAASVAETRLR